MKQSLLTKGLITLLWAAALPAEQIEIDIHGMTCAFCVDSLQRNLGKLPDVETAEVSLKLKKVRIETRGETTDIERIKQTVLDSGFTPVKVTPLPDAQ
jgi:copper chaperone CopZ